MADLLQENQHLGYELKQAELRLLETERALIVSQCAPSKLDSRESSQRSVTGGLTDGHSGSRLLLSTSSPGIGDGNKAQEYEVDLLMHKLEDAEHRADDMAIHEADLFVDNAIKIAEMHAHSRFGDSSHIEGKEAQNDTLDYKNTIASLENIIEEQKSKIEDLEDEITNRLKLEVQLVEKERQCLVLEETLLKHQSQLGIPLTSAEMGSGREKDNDLKLQLEQISAKLLDVEESKVVLENSLLEKDQEVALLKDALDKEKSDNTRLGITIDDTMLSFEKLQLDYNKLQHSLRTEVTLKESLQEQLKTIRDEHECILGNHKDQYLAKELLLKQEVEKLKEEHDHNLAQVCREHDTKAEALQADNDRLLCAGRTMITEYEGDISKREEVHDKRIADLGAVIEQHKRDHNEHIKSLLSQHEKEIGKKMEQVEAQYKVTIEHHENTLEAHKSSHEDKYNELKDRHEETISEYKQRLEEANSLHEKATEKYEALLRKKEQEADEKHMTIKEEHKSILEMQIAAVEQKYSAIVDHHATVVDQHKQSFLKTEERHRKALEEHTRELNQVKEEYERRHRQSKDEHERLLTDKVRSVEDSCKATVQEYERTHRQLKEEQEQKHRQLRDEHERVLTEKLQAIEDRHRKAIEEHEQRLQQHRIESEQRHQSLQEHHEEKYRLAIEQHSKLLESHRDEHEQRQRSLKDEHESILEAKLLAVEEKYQNTITAKEQALVSHKEAAEEKCQSLQSHHETIINTHKAAFIAAEEKNRAFVDFTK